MGTVSLLLKSGNEPFPPRDGPPAACIGAVGPGRESSFLCSIAQGYTVSSRKNDVTTPPIMGAAIRFMTSAQIPVLQRTGTRPTIIVAAVMSFGRSRFAGTLTHVPLVGQGQVEQHYDDACLGVAARGRGHADPDGGAHAVVQ
jgi:hypothetical protein